MGLIFPRVAHNFIKNGYFPTDEQTLEGVLAHLDSDGGSVRVLDPCCGCGTALEFVRDRLVESGAVVETFGVEFDSERAWHAKNALTRVIHSDVNDVHVTPRGVGLLFLNPPYGHALRDDNRSGDRKQSDRLEKMFFRKSIPWLATNGVLVLIVPFAVIDREFAQMIAKQFTDVEIRMAPEKKFRQVVIFGRKKRSESPSVETVTRLLAVGQSGYEACATLDPSAPAATYVVPSFVAGDKFGFVSLKVDAKQLGAELASAKVSTLWPTFRQFAGSTKTLVRRPLRELSDWHLALALAAGQIGGIVRSSDGRDLLIKGDTLKDKVRSSEEVVGENGSISVTTVLTDRFVPTIKAIDLTRDSDRYGEVFTIK
ncbi:MAG: SAM-dependent methyltransferase [Betaproteobacteria bacterium]|nr:MAG: SAM-dependent methyltransferase [Betaproteobacteria bacterium]